MGGISHTRLILIAIFLLAVGTGYSQNLFSYDPDRIDAEMKELRELENYVVLNAEGGIQRWQEQGTILFSDLKGNPVKLLGLDEQLYGIPPFYWGCLMSGLGVVIVYKTTGDSTKTRQAFMGCVVNGVFFTGVYLVNMLVSY